MIARVRDRISTAVDKLTRGVRLGDHFLGLFVPFDQKGDGDAVRALAPAIMARLKKPPVCVLLDRACDNVSSASTQAGLSGPPSRLAIFAHPNEAESGFAVNPIPGE